MGKRVFVELFALAIGGVVPGLGCILEDNPAWTDAGFYGPGGSDAGGVGSTNPTATTGEDSGSATVGAPTGGTLPPVAVDDSASTFINVAVNIDVLANDQDPGGGILSITSVGSPGSGTTRIEGTNLVYTPALDFIGSATFEYSISDGNEGTAVATVEVVVDGVCDTWNAAWPSRVALSFDQSVFPEPLDDFPVLIALDSATVAGLGITAGGADLRFVDADNTTLLAHEVERWDPLGTSFVWLRVPRIDAGSVNDFVWMYHGNESAPDAQQGPEVWSNGYVAVWHMADDPTLGPDAYDSTGHGHTGQMTNHAGGALATEGQIGGGLVLAEDEYLEVPDHDDLDLTEALSLEAWVRPNFVDLSGNRYPVYKLDAYLLFTARNYTDKGQMRAWLGPPASDFTAANAIDPLVVGQWAYVTGTFDADAQVLRLFYDGMLEAARDLAADGDRVSPIASSSNPVRIGMGSDGSIDEVRISSVARTPAWIDAQNLSMRRQFVTIGSSAASCR